MFTHNFRSIHLPHLFRYIMDFLEDSVLHIGAEAKVWSGTFLGKQAIKKVRKPRSWRHPSLDHRLGTKRMLNEAKLLIRLFNSGLDVPALLDVNLEDGYLIETRLEGEELKTKLAGDYELEIKHNFLRETGKSIRKLHCLAITHGDLSTNNILIHNQKARLIDFGLAKVEYDLEGFGIDLHVVDEILSASNPDIDGAIDYVLQGYASENNQSIEREGGNIPSSDEVIERLEEIRTRVRYHD